MRLPISRHEPTEQSYGITTADSSHLSDISRRQRQYIWTMLLRLVLLLVVVLVPGPTLLERTVLGLVATIIPYFAVVRANGGPDLSEAPTNMMVGAPRQSELPGPDRSLGGTHRIDADGEPIDGDDASFGWKDEPAAGEDEPVAGEEHSAGGERDTRVQAEWVEAEGRVPANAEVEEP
ncbi:DUF3099 domain-containing protein [Actinospica robiniae]|uniref:DUF3099 domain-containing protein n=1 Tax=Actinospica robiniae TaxID=304901 RepID=UPI0003FD741E|nr:DUF3099 domain-containing protein [Actinospica robiniae]